MFSKNEAWLLNILYFLGKKKEDVDLNKLDDIRQKYSEVEFSWLPVIKKVKTDRLISEKNGCFLITEKGRDKIVLWNKESRRTGFNKSLLARDKSEVYRKFCEKIYGEFLCQMNMTNMEQLNKLIEMLKLDKRNSVLDLGCGMGRVSEYISDKTKARITGIDIADEAVLKAQERTKGKNHRITFQVGNIDEMCFEPSCFDRIIAVDTIYFSNNLLELIKNLKRILTDNGIMGILFSQRIGSEDQRKKLQADNTDLAVVLKKNGFKFKTCDFTDDEKKHWNDEIRVANELKDEFIKAGESEIYNSRIREATDHLAYIEDDRLSRYLYIIEKD
jgi:cyclopropane fatty-acyl-phospholipid synthase-like methyltransferase